MELQSLFFAFLAIFAIASAVVTIASKHPVKSAMSLIVHFFSLAGLYLTLNAEFVSIVQILVYAGAIMVLVVFVIMLLNLGDEEKLKLKFNLRFVFASLFGVVLVFQLVSAFLVNPDVINVLPTASLKIGTAEAIGKELYTNYIIPFEAISFLLLAAIVGAVMLAKKKID